MKKLLLLFVFMLIFFSCEKSKKDNIETPDNPKMEIIEESVTLESDKTLFVLDELPNSFQIKMINNLKEPITTGEHYRIQLFEDKTWTDFLPENIAFHDIGYRIESGNSKEFEIKFFKENVSYKKGKYRIVKYYLDSDYSQTQQSQDIYLEFEII